MYLSKLLLNKGSREVRLDLNDCQQLHRTVMSAFPMLEKKGLGARSECGVLYRLEAIENGKIALLVQSKLLPEWNKLPDKYVLSTPNSSLCKEIDFIYEQLEDGMVLNFRLRANPTHKQRGKRIPIKGEIGVVNWLKQKGEVHGFELVKISLNSGSETIEYPNLESTREHVLTGSKSNGTEKIQILFNSVLFDGELIITKKDMFVHTLMHGVGSGKGYGFGLLSINLA